MHIPFNKVYISGLEMKYIGEAIESGNIAGDGLFTKKCQHFFETNYGFKKTFLTTSCTDALEMAAILLNIKQGDEVIVPSYAFVSSANAFLLRGAQIIFADSQENHPNINVEAIEPLINKKTKAIVIIHYAGVACDMDRLLSLSKKYNVPIIEDTAQAIDSYHKNLPLGRFGAMAAFSFHATKNITAGESGMLVINDDQYNDRAEIIREKGTNRTAFFRGEIDKYGWVDVGSSFLPSDILAAFLYAQLQHLNIVQDQRKKLWEYYYKLLVPLKDHGKIDLPFIPDYAKKHNAHLFYIVCKSGKERNVLLSYLKKNGVQATFHYLPLHLSNYFKKSFHGKPLTNAEKFANCIIRLPLFHELTFEQINYVAEKIYDYYNIKLNN